MRPGNFGTPTARPKTRPGDYERALELVASLGGDLKTKKYLAEMQQATLVHDKARAESEAATAAAKLEVSAAREAEDRTRLEREALATETKETEGRLRSQRSELQVERLRLEEWDRALAAKELDFEPREAALRRAFDAYHGGV